MVTLASASFPAGIAHNFPPATILPYIVSVLEAFPGDFLPAFGDPQIPAVASPVMSSADASGMAGLDPENPYALTALELQVVDLLLSGLTGDEVADLLAVDRRRVALCRAGAMRKYGARNSLHLAHLVAITRRTVQSEQLIALEDVPSGIAS